MSTDKSAGEFAFPISGGPVLVTYDLPQWDLIAWCGHCRKWRLHGVSVDRLGVEEAVPEVLDQQGRKLIGPIKPIAPKRQRPGFGLAGGDRVTLGGTGPFPIDWRKSRLGAPSPSGDS